MATLAELTVQVLTARLSRKDMTLDELQAEISFISNMIKAIDEGTEIEPAAVGAPEKQVRPEKINFRKIFKKDKVVCLVCNKEFSTLKRHLAMAHQLKPAEYKKQFNIPAKYALIAPAYSHKKKQDALNRGLADNLVKARAKRANKKSAVRAETPVPAAKTKAPVPLKKTKTAIPTKTTKSDTTKRLIIKPAKPVAKAKTAKTIVTGKLVKTRKKK